MSADSHWPKASHSFTLCLSKVLKSEEGNGKTKDQPGGAFDKEMGICMSGKEKKTTQGLKKK